MEISFILLGPSFQFHKKRSLLQWNPPQYHYRSTASMYPIVRRDAVAEAFFAAADGPFAPLMARCCLFIPFGTKIVCFASLLRLWPRCTDTASASRRVTSAAARRASAEPRTARRRRATARNQPIVAFSLYIQCKSAASRERAIWAVSRDAFWRCKAPPPQTSY